ncbi:hypothetical protein OWR29_16665 [Actinoplanes sp. Pm04-4]|uniref:Uncharacterized protein n=1 Tax=Paractinoplanes pyxinae TaxID=2997416 RepID=A0ABT4AZK8_9ACTN|nr:hypothetical protein [Actinoplanes pyxinae]MCY1139634.1 hypothetical protein [Actinoplanes pyxinae]
MTAAPETARLGNSSRGSLRREDDRLVRVLDPRQCDERFRTALAEIRGREWPDTLPILTHGPAGDGYRIEYAADGILTLAEAFEAVTHWSGRLILVADVCEAVDVWHRGRAAGLGLDAHTVVVKSGSGGIRLAPCPPVRPASPLDLSDVDPGALAAVAPEAVRGLPAHQRAEDVYALGTLAALALGIRPEASGDGPGRVERQARGVLLKVSATATVVEPFLHTSQRLEALLTTIRRCRNDSVDARPTDGAGLRRALLAMADLTGLAEEVWLAGDPAGARSVLSRTGPGFRSDWLAARIATAEGDGATAFEQYRRAVETAPTQYRLRQQRFDDMWALWQAAADPPPEWARALLDDLAFLRPFGELPPAELWLREAEVHERAGTDGLYRAARALYEATIREPDSFAVLLRYARCQRRISEVEGRADAAEVDKIRQVVSKRLDTMLRIKAISREEAQRWRTQFDDV